MTGKRNFFLTLINFRHKIAAYTLTFNAAKVYNSSCFVGKVKAGVSEKYAVKIREHMVHLINSKE